MSKHNVKASSAALALLVMAEVAAAQSVPLPRPRPVDGAIPANPETAPAAAPSACRLRLTSERAIAPSIASIDGPAECGSDDLVRLEAVILSGKGRVAITPPAVLRCVMAEAVVDWVREDLAPLAELSFGSPPRLVQSYTGYNCRPRNNIAGAMTSEHGKGNALDVGPIKFLNGKTIDLADQNLAPEIRESLKRSACRRFSTVLGPGSDAYHANHVHLDLRERRNGYRICQWDILTSTVPLPRPKPDM
jgi:hypothetical protein